MRFKFKYLSACANMLAGHTNTGKCHTDDGHTNPSRGLYKARVCRALLSPHLLVGSGVICWKTLSLDWH